MLVLLMSLVSTSPPLTYTQARELAFQTPYALDAESHGTRVAARRGRREGDGWTFRLFSRNCVSRSCLIGWVHVDRNTGAITDPIAEKPISSQHLTAVEADLRK